jgi:hypothetical protein
MTPSYDTKMLLKIVFYKTMFVKFKISNSFKQSIDKTHSKQQKTMRKSILAYEFKNPKKKICEFQRENRTLVCGFKIFRNLAKGFQGDVVYLN